MGVSGGGIFLHRMDGADPGLDLHDHPWTFWSFIVAGGYTEERAHNRDARMLAEVAECWPETCTRGVVEERRRFSLKAMRLDECHRITGLTKRRSWSVVVHGPKRRGWGFYLPTAHWMPWQRYEEEVRAERRDMYAEISNVDDIDHAARIRRAVSDPAPTDRTPDPNRT